MLVICLIYNIRRPAKKKLFIKVKIKFDKDKIYRGSGCFNATPDICDKRACHTRNFYYF